MHILLLISFLLPTVLSVKFPNGAVITSQDVKYRLDGHKLNFFNGQKTRVYAVYASSAPNDDYASNVIITGAGEVNFTVAQLARAKLNTAYVLEENNLLQPPITIKDTNVPTATRVPYTIYFVNFEVYGASRVSPVVSAQLIQSKVNVANISSTSCTVLSAEPAFQISDIDTSHGQIQVSTAGYDSAAFLPYVVMYADDWDEMSSREVTISGPIANLHLSDDNKTDINFVVRKDGLWSGNLAPGARTVFLSNGWLTSDSAYPTDYKNAEVLSRSYDFGRDTQTSIFPNFPSNLADGDSIKISCATANGKVTDYYPADFLSTEGYHTNRDVLCKTVSLKVVALNAPGPRFSVDIDSGAFSTSMFLLLVASSFGALGH